MMNSWLRYAQLTAEAKSGLSAGAAIWAIVALVALIAAATFISVAGFVWIADRYDNSTAALALAGFYFCLAILAALAVVLVHRHTVSRARRALAERPPPWLEPRVVAIGVEIGKTLGWKKTLPIAVVGLLAAGVAREWLSAPAATDET
jgi:hypothetical protein